MNLLWAGFIIVGVAAVAAAAMLLVRRSAPAGSYFSDGDRASGVFGVLASGFAILVGFVVFLSFESYDTSRSGSETEARTVVQQLETAQFMTRPAPQQLSGELICYARYVISREWPAMRAGTLSEQLNPWGIAMFRTLRTVDPRTAAQQAAYSKWLDQTSDRENARADRVHGAEGVIPFPLWVVLFLTAGTLFVYMLFFADSAERWFVQATMMATTAIVITSTLLLLFFLNSPYHSGSGGLQPVAMQRTLGQLTRALAVVGERVTPPCGVDGNPLRR